MTITFPLPWWRIRSLPDAETRRQRYQQALRRAIGKTRYARQYDANAGLSDLPRIDLLEFLCHTDRYSVASERPPARHQLSYPVGDAPRTAVIGRTVAETRKVRNFQSLRSDQMATFNPHAVAAPVDALRAHVDDAEPLRNAVIAFTDILSGPLSADDGDRFWDSYQVPVFEQFLGFDGELLAWECEIHHGLHVNEETALFTVGGDDLVEVSFLSNRRLPVMRLVTGLCGRLVSDPCPCGNLTPRLVDLRRREVHRKAPVRTLAAAV